MKPSEVTAMTRDGDANLSVECERVEMTVDREFASPCSRGLVFSDLGRRPRVFVGELDTVVATSWHNEIYGERQRIGKYRRMSENSGRAHRESRGRWLIEDGWRGRT